jgi:hypothetical protein
MFLRKICIFSTVFICGSTLLFSGCGGDKQQQSIALRFSPQAQATYKMIDNAQESLKFGGSLAKSKNFTDTSKTSRLEMVFDQNVLDSNDNTILVKITIKELKYLASYKDDLDIDFDSTRQQDAISPFAKLIGQSYSLKYSDAGQVLDVTDLEQARDLLKGPDKINSAAMRLFSKDAIKARHSIAMYPETVENEKMPGDEWSKSRTFDFRMMGKRKYDRVYKLEELKDVDGKKVAVVKMNAYPSPDSSDQGSSDSPLQLFMAMFNMENIMDYSGETQIDLSTKEILKSQEKLTSQWIVVDPDTEKANNPDAVKIGVERSKSLEKIN